MDSTVDTSLTPSVMKFGNDVVVPQPSQTNTQNYTVLSSDSAKQDYLTKQNWMNTEQQNIVNQSLQNQQNTSLTDTNNKQNSATDNTNNALKSATDALNGTSSQGTTASGNSYTKTGNDYTDTLAGQNADASAMYKSTQDALTKASTTAGLSDSQRTQMSSLSQQFDQLITQQTQANSMYQGGVQTAGIRTGESRYAGNIAAGEIKQAVDQGLAKISDLTSKKNDALNKMQQGFISDNMKSITDAYKEYQDYTKQVTDNIKEMHAVVKDQHDQALADQTLAFNQYKQQQTDAQDARDFAVKNNVDKAFYQVGNSVFDTASGQEVDPSKVDASQVFAIDPNSQAGLDYVKTLSQKYGDTVFPTMTPEQAQKAMQYSKIYKEQVRPPQYVTDPTSKGQFKFDSSGSSRLLSAGLTNSEISAIQTNLNAGNDINSILSASTLSDDEKKAVKDVMGGVTPGQANKNTDQFLSPEWYWQNYSREQLTQSAKDAGIMKNIKWGKDVGDPDAYIAAKMKEIQRDRTSGMTDADIYSKNLSK